MLSQYLSNFFTELSPLSEGSNSSFPLYTGADLLNLPGEELLMANSRTVVKTKKLNATNKGNCNAKNNLFIDIGLVGCSVIG